MLKCPVLRPELKDLPERMQRLPLDPRGYPVPYFVGKVEGEWDFRFMDQDHWYRAVNQKLCWVCGEKLGAHLAFVTGPMCAVTRTTSEPACHRDCGRWSCRFCPFLTRPHMVRREDELTRASEANIAGHALMRNPGVTCLWVTRSFTTFRDEKGAPLIRVGEPESTEWWAAGRSATRAEVEESLAGGIPFLKSLAAKERGGLEHMEVQIRCVEALLPA